MFKRLYTNVLTNFNKFVEKTSRKWGPFLLKFLLEYILFEIFTLWLKFSLMLDQLLNKKVATLKKNCFSTGWFQERIWTRFHNQTKNKLMALWKIYLNKFPHYISSKQKQKL